MSFLDFINNIQHKPKEYRIKIFVVIMILAAIIVFTVFGFSVKYVLRDSSSEKTDSVEENISLKLPSVFESLKASISEVFKFKREIEDNIESIGDEKSVEAEGYRLPSTR